MNDRSRNEPLSEWEQFLNSQRNYQDLKNRIQKIEKRIPNFENTLQEIRSHYQNSFDSHQAQLSTVLNLINDENIKQETQIIHSTRYRIKDVDSLIVKIIDKCVTVPKEQQNNPEIEKYRNITKDNYYKIITDMIGVRILIRYRYQWEAVHNFIWDLYYKGDDKYVTNWEEQYTADTAEVFIAEKPKAYYKLPSDKTIYESIGKGIFDFYKSDKGYASIHYIINVRGTYMELQVRTILDEMWGETSHDFFYKILPKDAPNKKVLKGLCEILSDQLTAAESTVTFMCEITGKAGDLEEGEEETDSGRQLENKKIYSSILEHAKLLSDMPSVSFFE